MRATERTLSDDVAEKVMGWQRGTCEGGHQSSTHRCEFSWHWYTADGEEKELAEPDTDYYNPQDAWSPEDDIADAWQVVEWAEASPRGWKLTLMRSGRSLPDYVWICTFHRGHQQLSRVVERTVPLAICRAALDAVGVVPESV